jgi:hypothetical protein
LAGDFEIKILEKKPKKKISWFMWYVDELKMEDLLWIHPLILLFEKYQPPGVRNRKERPPETWCKVWKDYYRFMNLDNTYLGKWIFPPPVTYPISHKTKHIKSIREKPEEIPGKILLRVNESLQWHKEKKGIQWYKRFNTPPGIIWVEEGHGSVPKKVRYYYQKHNIKLFNSAGIVPKKDRYHKYKYPNTGGPKINLWHDQHNDPAWQKDNKAYYRPKKCTKCFRPNNKLPGRLRSDIRHCQTNGKNKDHIKEWFEDVLPLISNDEECSTLPERCFKDVPGWHNLKCFDNWGSWWIQDKIDMEKLTTPINKERYNQRAYY